MRFSLRLAGAAMFALTPLSYVAAQGAGKDLAMDFRTIVTVQGMPDTGVIQGHAVGSGDKLRMDLTMKGPGAQVSPLGSANGAISMILSDSGKTVTYLDSKTNRYLRVRPSDMLAQAQQMGGVKMDFSGTEATVDNLGSGPTILGHPTSHYRVGTGMTMTISAMGQQQTVKISSTSDYFYATDIKGVLNPFVSLSGSDMASTFGGANKEFADKMKAMTAKLPKGTPLRASSTATMIAQGQTRVTNTQAEVTSIQWVEASPKLFEVPSTYTAVALPAIGGASGGAIPPK
ncbi:MAG TPA: hypothetical protein VE052_07035 [Gemmatimonadaceae bacterium]|nr:hypothetical protein [Gemmatimonadaceae bacterium]